jgi:hypothetical protein
MSGSMSKSWRRDSNETASDEPGAVHNRQCGTSFDVTRSFSYRQRPSGVGG